MSLPEKGRYHNIKPSERVCPFCPDKVEDEFHFLIKCPKYKIQRQNLLEQIKTIVIEFFYPNDEQFLFWFLLTLFHMGFLQGLFHLGGGATFKFPMYIENPSLP